MEKTGRLPVPVVSEDVFNHGPAGPVIVLPLTATHRGVPSHVPIAALEGGPKTPRVILGDAMRSIAKDRLILQWGTVSSATMAAVEDRLHILLALYGNPREGILGLHHLW